MYRYLAELRLKNTGLDYARLKSQNSFYFIFRKSKARMPGCKKSLRIQVRID
jgi:hypothetical protein